MPFARYDRMDSSSYLNVNYDGEMLFTYDVLWDITDMPWTQR